MKKTLCILLSILICFSTTFVAANALENIYKMGDVDLDNSVNIFDVTAIQLHLAKYTQLSDTQRILADVDIDGYVNIFDATTIQLYLAKIIDEFPQPETEVPTELVTEPTEEKTEATTEAPTEVQTDAPIIGPTQPETEIPTELVTEPTEEETEATTEAPTQVQTDAPIIGPTQPETEIPTEPVTVPTEEETKATTEAPTEVQTDAPIIGPTQPETEVPTDPVTEPTEEETEANTEAPTEVQTDAPIIGPTQPETEVPTEPVTEPTEEETEATTEAPTEVQTDAPIIGPTQPETEVPTEPVTVPTEEETEANTEAPTEVQTDAPIIGPTQPETEVPTDPVTEPTEEETEATTEAPTEVQTDAPIIGPTQPETEIPTELVTEPTEEETEATTEAPTEVQTDAPIIGPTQPETEVPTEPVTEPTEEKTEATTEAPTEVQTDAPIIGPTQPETEVPTEPVTEPTEEETEVTTEAPTQDPCVSYAQKLRELQGDNTLTLSLMSDVHYDEKDLYNRQKAAAIRNLGKVQQVADVDLTCLLGDLVIGNVGKETTLTSMNALLDLYKDNLNTPLLTIRGNHDDNGWYTHEYEGTNQADEIINNEEWWDIVSGMLPNGFVIDSNNPYGGYGYYDHEESKTRIFMLNSSDIPYIQEEDGAYRYNGYQCFAYSNEQLNFVANSLQFSDKDNKDEWAALFLSHIPVETSNSDGERFGGVHALVRGAEQLSAIIESYRKGSLYSFDGSVYNVSSKIERPEDFKVSVDVDYTQKGQGEVICFVSGHTHADNYSDEVGGENSLTYGYSYIGVVGSTAFTNLVVNRDNNTVSVLKYGKAAPEIDPGVVKSDVDSGSVESGEWTIQYTPLADISPKYVEMSQVYPMHYNFDGQSGIDLETMEVVSAVQVAAPRVLTKAVAVKPTTAYVLPKDFSGLCLCYNKAGSKRTYLKITDYGDYKMVTTTASTRYVSFSLDTSFYHDYENFYIMELHSEAK